MREREIYARGPCIALQRAIVGRVPWCKDYTEPFFALTFWFLGVFKQYSVELIKSRGVWWFTLLLGLMFRHMLSSIYVILIVYI